MLLRAARVEYAGSDLTLQWYIREPWPGNDANRHLTANVHRCPGDAARMRDRDVSRKIVWTLVAGDFNVGFPISRDGRTRYPRQVARTWEAQGLASVYHAFFDVAMGQESRPTFFDERRRQLGWHIDYVLIHTAQLHRVRNVELGDYWEWVASGRSDHVPLIIDLDW